MKLYHFAISLYRKYREMFWYLVVGVLTTAVDLAVYYLLGAYTSLHYSVIYWIGWAASVLFAFFPNRALVFQNHEKKGMLHQFWEFVSSRVATLIIGEVLLSLLVSICHFPDTLMKPVVQVLIVILNYFLSKLLVFRKK